MAKNMILSVKEDLQHDNHEIKVRKANDLIQHSRFNLTKEQQRIVLYVLSQIKPTDKDGRGYKFNFAEFCKVCGIDGSGDGTYRHLRESLAGLTTNNDKGKVWLSLPDGGHTTFSWISEAYYNEGKNIAEIDLNRRVLPYLLELKNRYTEYELIYTLHFRSKYTIRLYELIKSRHYHEMEEYTFNYTIDELRQLLGAETYKEYRDFKRKAIVPAVREINEASDITVEWVESPPARRGVRVLSIEFTVRPKAAAERMKIRDEIECELGWDQIALW